MVSCKTILKQQIQTRFGPEPSEIIRISSRISLSLKSFYMGKMLPKYATAWICRNRLVVQKSVHKGLTRCGARRTLYTPAIWLIRGNVRLNKWTGGARWGSGTLAEYSNGSVSSTYCIRQVSDILTEKKTVEIQTTFITLNYKTIMC